MKDKKVEAAWKTVKRFRMLEAGFELFSERGIESVTMPEVAAKSLVGRATLYRYYPSKPDLVIAISAWKWKEYITSYAGARSRKIEEETGAESLKYFLDSFLDLYRNHSDILRFNYNFNSFLKHETTRPDQDKAFLQVLKGLEENFHEIYKKGTKDGTLVPDVSEQAMFSFIFHIMLAAVTRYATGLVYIPESGTDPESELVMLEEMLLNRFTRKPAEASAK